MDTRVNIMSPLTIDLTLTASHCSRCSRRYGRPTFHPTVLWKLNVTSPIACETDYGLVYVLAGCAESEKD